MPNPFAPRTSARFGPLAALLGVALLLAVALPQQAMAVDDQRWQAANASIKRGIEFLRQTQNKGGSWTPEPGPAITALCMQAMLDQPDISESDPAVQKAIDYILSKAKDDGGIHDGFLQNYNTSISVSALSRIHNRPDVAEAIKKAQGYLQNLQWSNQPGPDGKPIDESHPFYGGAGYGKHGRPDMSNTQFLVQALYDSGLDCEDPAFKRAMVFINRCQAHESNDMFDAEMIPRDGGFIYATSISKELVGVPESKANPQLMDEAVKGGPVSGLRTYGSITYAGFKSYLYADLGRDDPRVKAAMDWITRNYTLEHNPGMPEAVNKQGLYYYYMVFGRALRAYGQPIITTADGQSTQWANDLIDALAKRQQDDGSWSNDADRWMEGDPNLVTAYSLLALTNAIR